MSVVIMQNNIGNVILVCSKTVNAAWVSARIVFARSIEVVGSFLYGNYFYFIEKKFIRFSEDFEKAADYFYFFCTSKRFTVFDYTIIDLLRIEIDKLSNYYLFLKKNSGLFTLLKNFFTSHRDAINNILDLGVFLFLEEFPFNLDNLVEHFFNLKGCLFLTISLQDFFHSKDQLNIFFQCIEMLSGVYGKSLKDMCIKIEYLQQNNFCKISDPLSKLKYSNKFDDCKNELNCLINSFNMLSLPEAPVAAEANRVVNR